MRPSFKEFSLGLWPHNTKWGTQQLTAGSIEKINRRWVVWEVPREMHDWTSLDTDQVIRHFCGLDPDGDPANEGLTRLQSYNTNTLWRDVMLWCLKYQKDQALMLLLATYKGRKYRPPRYMVSDALESLAHHYLYKKSTPDPMVVDSIWLLTRSFVDGANDQERTFHVAQHVIYTILKQSDDSRVLSLYFLLAVNKTSLHVHTMLHLLERFVDMGRLKLAMTLLRTIASTGFDLSYGQIQMACIKLLRANVGSQSEYNVRSNILMQILEIGVSPNIRMFNTILLNMGESDDFTQAWHLYRAVKGNALMPDPDTYCVLLKGAELSGKVSNLEMVVHEIQTNGNMLKDLRLLSDMLNAVSLLSPGHEFEAMLDVYRQYCDLTPLQTLSLCGEETRAPPNASCSEVLPTKYILSRMILAYIRRNQGSLNLLHNYNQYYQCVKESHPSIAPLAETDYVANAFLLAFGNSPSTLRHCTIVVKHMLELSSRKDAIPGSVIYAAPTVQTWSILVDNYFRNKQRHAGEQVLAMMRQRGMKPNQVTWNSVIKGYAILQDVRATMDAVKGMRAAGFETDSYTVNALGKLWMQDRLMELLQTRTERPFDDKNFQKSIVIPLDPEDEFEATTVQEWEARIPDKVDKLLEVNGYLDAKVQEQSDMEEEDQIDYGLLVPE